MSSSTRKNQRPAAPGTTRTSGASSGPGSGVYKSVDGGDHWTRLAAGLPADLGRVGLAISPAAPGRVYAVDVQPQMIALLTERMRQRGVNAISLQPEWCALRPGVCDLTA